MRGPLLTIAIACGLWGAAVFLSPEAGVYRSDKDQLLYYPNGRFLQEAVLGYDQAAAALAWLQLVQYYGEHARGDEKYDYLYHCGRDYRAGPAFRRTLRSGVRAPHRRQFSSAGMRLLQKGVNTASSWKILFEAVHLLHRLGRRSQSRPLFTKAAGHPRSSEYATVCGLGHVSGEDHVPPLWQELAERTTNPEIRKRAEEKMAELTASLGCLRPGDPVMPVSAAVRRRYRPRGRASRLLPQRLRLPRASRHLHRHSALLVPPLSRTSALTTYPCWRVWLGGSAVLRPISPRYRSWRR
jgi:hypothetical protein